MKNELNKLLENRIYNNEECVSKIEKLVKEIAIDFSLWITQNEYQKTELTRYALWKVYKEQKL